MSLTKKLGQYAAIGLMAVATGCSTMQNYNGNPDEAKATELLKDSSQMVHSSDILWHQYGAVFGGTCRLRKRLHGLK